MAFALIQVWAVLLALIIEKSLTLIKEMKELTEVQTWLLLIGGWVLISLVIYAFYKDLTLLKSLEGLTDQILPDHDVARAKKLLKQIKQNKPLSDEDAEFMKGFSEIGLLPNDFVAVYVEKKWSLKQTLQMKAAVAVVSIIAWVWSNKKH
ncbi:MAG: hypothetical protein H6602_14050 [Flavobacteriales bacterium]|nr:hypothetical protein [Flavobacteriales bacterium]